MPLRRFVVEITNEANAGDDISVRKAVKAWHNRLSNGSIPRCVVTKVGRGLFIDIEEWESWLNGCRPGKEVRSGRPRNV